MLKQDMSLYAVHWENHKPQTEQISPTMGVTELLLFCKPLEDYLSKSKKNLKIKFIVTQNMRIKYTVGKTEQIHCVHRHVLPP